MDKRLLLGETKYIEYKEKYTKSILKTICAFANYHEGQILVGVNDDGVINGVDNVDELRLSIENSINDNIDPRPYYELKAEYVEEKNIIIIEVLKGEYTPYSVNNKTYKRYDTSTVPVDRIAHKELILLGMNKSFESLKIDKTDLDFIILTSKLKKSLGISKVTEVMLITLGLMENKLYNNAAMLMSDDNTLQSKIQLVAYKSNNVMHIKDRKELSNMSIIEQYDRCIDFFEKHINVEERIEGPYRQTIEEIPQIAYREAVANAIVHRDYSREVDIRIEVYTDRIEIVSPGTLPVGLSEEEFRNGNVSILRNRIIADVFFRLKIIEKIGTGIKRIIRYYQDYDVKPSLQVFENSISVILPKVMIELDSDDYYNSKLDMHNENEMMIIQLLKEKNSLSRNEIEKSLGLKRSQTGNILRSLRERNLIIKVGGGSNVKYKLVM